MRTYSIYIIRNTVNNKVYIGQTSQSVKVRFAQHKKPSVSKQRGTYKIYNAMNKYGKDKFYVEELECGIKETEIDEKEIEYIQKYDSFNNGYNSTLGGDGRTITKMDDVDLFVKIYQEGTKEKEIAKIFNVNIATVRRTAEALKLKNRIKLVTKEYLIANQDKTNIEIAKELGVHTETVTRAVKKYGIKRGKGYSNHKNKQNKHRIDDSRKDEFCKIWFDRSIPLQEMANHFCISKRQLFLYAEYYGLPKRRTIQNQRMS